MRDTTNLKNKTEDKPRKSVLSDGIIKPYLPLVFWILVLVGICIVFFNPNRGDTPWSDRETNFFQLGIAIAILFVGNFYGRVTSGIENKRSATSAFRRIIDIEKSLERQSQFLNRLRGQKELNPGEIDVLIEQNYSLADTVKSSRRDWDDIIGDVIKDADRMLTLENTKMLYQGDTERYTLLSSQIEELKAKLPYTIQAGITEKAAIKQPHISSMVVKYFVVQGNKTAKITIRLRSSKPLPYLQELLKSRPPIYLRFTKEARFFWLRAFVQEESVGTVLSPFSGRTVSIDDFSYTLNSLLKRYLQTLNPQFLEAYEVHHSVVLENYELNITNNTVKISLPVDMEKFSGVFDMAELTR